MTYKILLGITITLTVVTWLFAGWRFQISDAFVPLHYTIYFGFDRFGPRTDLFLFPSLVTSIALLNGAIIHFVMKDKALWKTIMMALTLFFVLLILMGMILVVLKDLS